MLNAPLSSTHAGVGPQGRLRRALRLFLMLTIGLGLSFAQARAQSEQARGPADSGATASGNSATVNDPARAQSANGQAARPDRITSLRSQIANTPDGPARTRLQRTLVDYLIALGKRDEAIKELRTMMRENRSDPVGLYNTGNALARLGDVEAAIDAYRKAIELRRGNYARALNNLGVLLIRQKRWDEAEKALTSAARLENDRYAEASYNLGRLFAARGRPGLAIREWAHALAVQPDHVDAALALAKAYAASGDPERGLGVIDSFLNRQGPNEDLSEARREIIAGKGAVETRKPEPDGQRDAPAATPPAD